MEFPTWVPAVVRTHITNMIGGDAWESQGWAASLVSAEQQLAEIEVDINDHIRLGRTEYLFSLNKQKAAAVIHKDIIKAEVACLNRLGTDDRMRKVFDLLATQFSSDEQWRGFIRSAWAARMDYGPVRDRLKRAAELRDNIASTAEKLEKLLRDASSVGLDNWPSEFFNIPELLRRTDNHEYHDHNLNMWRAMRRHVLGDLPERDMPKNEQPSAEVTSSSIPKIEHVILKASDAPEIDSAEQQRNVLHYAWGTSPPLSALLKTVVTAARDFKPSEYGMMGAAVGKRTQNTRAEYIRAFGHLLVNEYNFNLTVAIKNAMAIVTDVVCEGPENGTSYDDVRKILPHCDEH